jgi:hypothetical protein
MTREPATTVEAVQSAVAANVLTLTAERIKTNTNSLDTCFAKKST